MDHTDKPTSAFGEALKQQVEERLHFFETGEPPSKNADAIRKVLDQLALDDDEEDEEDAADHNFEITFQMGGHIGPLTFGEPEDYDHDFDWGAHEHEHEHGDDEDDDYYDDEIYFGEYEEGFYDGMDAHDAEAHCKFPVRAVLNTRM